MEDNSLRKLRKAAGWPTAKAFADSIGVPAPTYARYEQSGDGPETNIPMKAAFTIADALGCSIDALVGREEADVDAVRSDMQRRYDALSDDGKQLVDDFLNMAEMREERAKKLRQAELARVYMKDARKLELQFLESLEGEDGGDGFMFMGTSEDMRAAFEEFALDMATAAEANTIDRRCETALRTMDEERVTELRRKLEEESDAKIEGVMDGIMAAYDSMHRDAGERVDYAVIDMNAER